MMALAQSDTFVTPIWACAEFIAETIRNIAWSSDNIDESD